MAPDSDNVTLYEAATLYPANAIDNDLTLVDENEYVDGKNTFVLAPLQLNVTVRPSDGKAERDNVATFATVEPANALFESSPRVTVLQHFVFTSIR